MSKLTRNQIFYNWVEQIPYGRVSSYGQIARLAGFPRCARQVGMALRALHGEEYNRVPWHRVVNHKGFISPRGIDGNDDFQRIRLESEGVRFNKLGGVVLEIYQWIPSNVI